MAWTASLPSVVTGNPTKASDYNNLLNNVLFRRDTTTGDVSQMIIAAGSDGSAAAPAIKRNADATGFYFAAGTVYLSCAGVLQGTFSSAGLVLPTGLTVNGWTGTNGLINTGNISTSLTVSGLYLGTLTSTAAFATGISMGTVTTNTVTGQTAAGINITGVSGFTAAQGINIGSVTATSTDVAGSTVSGFIGATSGSNSAVGGGAIVKGLFLSSTTATSSAGSGSNICQAYGIYIGGATATSSSGGATTFAAGLYITGVSASGGTATAYGVYVASTVHNYFAGNLRLAGGTLTPPAGATGVQYTGQTVSAGGAVAKAVVGAAGGNNAGWVEIYVGTTMYYVPYWAAS